MWSAGEKLGRFLLEKEIGQGSHGVVFVAKDTALDTPVAVKILHPWLTQDTAVRDRFKRELLLARRVAHTGVCRLFDLHEEGEAFFITMEFVEGQTILNLLKAEGRLQPLRAVKILRGVCQALAAAHTAGVIHRDLKPANIIVRAGDLPMILDFGTATAQDVSRVTRPGTAVGSMRFIAPEVFTGVAPSTRTDIYSLGVVAYVSLAGKLPYNAAAGAIEMLDMIKNQPPQRLDVVQPDMPKQLADAVQRAMEKNPDERYQTALEFDAALGVVEASLEGPSTGNFARWAPVAVVRESLAQAQPMTTEDQAPVADPTGPGSPERMPTTPDVARAVSGLGAGVTVVTPNPLAVPQPPPLAPPTLMKPRPDLTLGSVPPADATGEISGAFPVLHGAPITDEAPSGANDAVGQGGKAESNRASKQEGNADSFAQGDTVVGSADSWPPIQGVPGVPLPVEPDDGPLMTAEAQLITPEERLPERTLVAAPESFEGTLRLARPEANPVHVTTTEKSPRPRKRNSAAMALVAVGAVVVVAVALLLWWRDAPATSTSTADAGAADQSGTTDAGSGALVVGATDAGSVDAGDADAGGGAADAGVGVGAADAGAAMAVAAADAGAATTDAGGGVAEADAGTREENFDFGEGEGEPVESAGTGTHEPPNPVLVAVRIAKQKMQQKGLLPGDVPAADQALRRAWSNRGRTAEGLEHAREAGRLLDAQAVDRAFVLAKLQRFNTRYESAKKRNPKLADRVEPLSRAAGEAFSKAQYPQANKKLNAAFAALGK